MKRPLFRFVGGLLLAVLLFVAPARATDVPLTVRLSFAPGGAQGPEPASADAPAGDAWIFVLDHSGSMDRRDAMVDAELAPAMAGRTMERWKALLLAFKATLEQIEPGSVVQIVKVGGRKGAELTTGTSGVLVRNAKDVDLVFNNVRGWGGPDGGTPLYHGLYLACQEAQRFIKTEGRNACIVVFSDGKDESHSNRIRRQDDLGPFKSLFDEAGFNACLNWISETSSGLPPPPFGPKFVWAQPTKGGNVIPVVCRVRPRPTLVSLKNPVATGGLSLVSLSYAFPLSPQRWDALLAEGFDANVGLRTPDGRDIGGDVVHVAKGSTSADVVFNVPDSFFAGGKGAMFELALSLPPAAKVCRFIQPAPARLSFERQGAVTLSSVKPDAGVVAKVGEAVSFSAAGTEGASFAWTFGDGSSAQGARVSHSFSAPAPKGVSFSVAASKQGLSPATQAGTVVVVEAGVKLDPLPTGLKVGDTAVFSCRGQGEVASYDWFVDGEPAVGEDAKDGSSSKLSVPLAKVGDHAVRVRANMRRVSPEETPDVPFSVAPAPFAAIVKPEPNERFDAESVVPLEASVEGGFAAGVWTVRDASGAVVGEPIPSTVVASAAKANFPAPESGGDFAVSFVAGEGAAAKEAAPVPFSVKAKDVRLDVVSPVKDAPVRTGSAFELRAATAGLSGSVEFLLVDESSGAETRIAEAKIAADGSAAANHVFPVKDGRGERMLVAKASDGKVVSDPVPFTLETDAGLVLKSPANNARVEYGGALVFEAEPSGVVQAKDVRWFLRPAGGAEEGIEGGTGARYEHSFAAVPNRKALAYEVYARVRLPDGSPLETDHAAVRAVCPEILAGLDVPKEIAPGEEFSVRLKLDPKGAPAKAVVWDFGDGTKKAAGPADVVKHSFGTAGPRTVTATVSCGTCREEKAFPGQVLVRCPPLHPSIAIPRDGIEPDAPFSRGKPIRMELKLDPGADARATGIVWDFGDGPAETNSIVVFPTFADYGEKTVSVSVRCSACDSGPETASTSIRIAKIPPKAHFKICRTTSSDKPAGGRVPQGSTVSLVSTSTGDVAGLRWSVNGVPVPEFDDNPAPEFDCETVGKQVFSLVAVDPAGEESESETRSIRVYRRWLVVLLSFLAVLSIVLIGHLFAGNAPTAWNVSSLVSDGASLDPEAANAELQSSTGLSLKDYWSRLSKKAKIPLSDLGEVQSPANWGSGTENGKAKLLLKESDAGRSANDLSDDPGPAAGLGKQPKEMLLNTYENGRLFRIEAPAGDGTNDTTELWVRVDDSDSDSSPRSFLVPFVGLTVLVLALAFVLCALFAY